MSGKNLETRCPCCGSLFSVPGYDEADMCKAVKDGHYELVDDKIDGESFDGIMFWNKHTHTNYIIELTGDWDSVVDFTESDENFTDNKAKLIGCDPNELEDIDRPMIVYVIPEHGDSLFY